MCSSAFIVIVRYIVSCNSDWQFHFPLAILLSKSGNRRNAESAHLFKFDKRSYIKGFTDPWLYLHMSSPGLNLHTVCAYFSSAFLRTPTVIILLYQDMNFRYIRSGRYLCCMEKQLLIIFIITLDIIILHFFFTCQGTICQIFQFEYIF